VNDAGPALVLQKTKVAYSMKALPKVEIERNGVIEPKPK
jgi:hypothetical protein